MLRRVLAEVLVRTVQEGREPFRARRMDQIWARSVEERLESIEATLGLIRDQIAVAAETEEDVTVEADVEP